MAQRSFEAHTYTPTATADGTALANNTYQNIEASATTMLIKVSEIYEGGQATTSAVCIMQFARSGLPPTTPTALSNATAVDGFLGSFSTTLSASAAVAVAASTGPTRLSSNTHARLNLSFNAFGGIVRWQAPPGQEWGILGTANGNGSNLSAFTGGSVGLMGSHIIYEVM